ncbi:hypothetical protein NP493_74g00038 [Ridgeia piscesae]|uniref:Bystin n=1 Tax=Ridgeia piscesae TaxID=27915 RepID=A0AAD9UID7_RIDPI|nr:hypothetical protein NP493_74g00038 [Ridgeia piscesae]
MGKVKRSKGSKLELEKAKRQTPLAKQILEDDSVRPTGRTKQRQRNEDDEEYVDERLSRKILEQARSQQEELESEHGLSAPGRGKLGKKTDGKVRRTTSLGKPTDGSSDESSDDDEEEEMAGNEEIYDKFEVNEEDEKALEMFLSHNPPVRRTLADIIQEKITEKKTEIQTQFSDNASVVMQQLDDRVVNMYKTIGMILRKYRSGKLPKAFKIIPALNNWEQVSTSMERCGIVVRVTIYKNLL